ncbi:interleukin-1 receptor accessory protein-like isoform X2 [Plectropomus leopardus]|uniref:interleukin-1 receptor accessory protein-like isoform X2 n=1 Tax=Plectropomus leopardus TaxID=160734 RepID=UPI001C4DA30B|nr:interleukin-1 receptor accessory protein-like isoform X2 [Plectropomus leopardus]
MNLSSAIKVSKDYSPKIIGPDCVKIRAHPGEQLFLHCEALTNCQDVALIYWLVNDSFPEDTPSNDRIIESEESSLEDGAILKRSLLLKKVTPEDLKSTFTCVVTNTAGMSRKKVTLTAAVSSNCNGGRKRKHKITRQ